MELLSIPNSEFYNVLDVPEGNFDSLKYGIIGTVTGFLEGQKNDADSVEEGV